MNLSIAGKRAIVCGASAGLGLGCATALAAEGVQLYLAARGEERLLAAAEKLHADTGAIVTPIVCDVTTENGRRTLLAACPDPDILVTNAAGPPPGNFREWDESHWIDALRANMLAPIALVRATVDVMAQRRFGRIVNITSGAVKAPISVLGLSNGARSGLTGFISGIAREVANQNVTINNLLPGFFETERLGHAFTAMGKAQHRTAEAIRIAQQEAIPAGRFGTTEEFGQFCAFLCSAQAGYLTAQNILLDGGHYPGVF